MRSSGWLVGVVVPARDEEDHIADCVRAIRASLAGCRHISASWIVVVADCCSDGTVERARAALENAGEVIESAAGSPGTARRMGVDALLRRFPAASLPRLWIANTDADSEPTGDWIHRQINFARQGYAGVAGVVRVESIAGLGAEDSTTLLEYYVTHADGSHPHVHGANMGIRADAYEDAGGWSNLALAEDHCLWSRLKARNWPTIASTASVVFTSGRLIGRATGGFADSLRQRVELRYA